MKISSKISLSFFVTALVVVSFAGLIFYQIASRNLKREIVARLQVSAEAKKDNVDTYFKMLESAVSQISKSVLCENLLLTPQGDPGYSKAFELATKRLVWTQTADPTVKEFTLLDAAGKAISSSNPDSLGRDESANPVFAAGRKGISIGDAYYSEAYNAPSIDISAPVTNSKTGQSIGVLLAVVDMEDVFQIMTDRTGLGRTGEIFFVNKEGCMVTPSRFLAGTFLKQKVSTENYRRSLGPHAEEWPIVVAPDYRGVTIIGTHAHLAVPDWTIIAKINTDEVFLPLRKMKFAFFLIVLLTIVAATLMGLSVASLITAPIRSLREGINIVGSGDLAHKVYTSSRDEIGELSKAFDSMTDQLRKKIVSIDDLNREISGRKKVESDLVRKENLLNEMSAIAKVGGWELDTITDIVTWTEEVYRIHEVEPGREVTLKDDIGYYAPECVETIKKAVEEAIKNGKPFDEELAITTAKGRRLWVRAIGRPYYADGKLVKLRGIFQDITEMKKSEDSARASELKARAILDQTFEFIGLMTTSGILLEANRAALDFSGIDPVGVIGKPFWQTVWWSHSPELQDKLKRAVRTAAAGETVRFEATHIAKDGTTRFVDFILKPVKDGQGKVVFLVPEGRDVTEQRRAFDLVKQAAKEWEATFDSMSEGISIHNPDYTVINANLALCKLLGKRREEIIGGKCYNLFHGKKTPPSGCPLEKSKTTGKDEHAELYEPFLRRWLSASVSPVYDEAGNITKLIHVVSDITERKRYEEELARSEKLAALGRLASGAAHEIKNPLGIILGGVDLLRNRLKDVDSETKNMMSSIYAAVTRADSIINALAKLAEAPELNLKRLNMRQVMEDEAFLLKSKIAGRGIEVETDLAGGIDVEGDGERLREALNIVLQNAVDAAKDGGRISLKVSKDAAKCVIEIEDTGEGIAGADMPKIFEPFFTTRRDARHIGLGLPAAREIIAAHKGDISVKSRQGAGTTVRIELPAVA